jgi:hypothetical protein
LSIKPAYVPRVSSATPELGWRVKPLTVHLVNDGPGGRPAQQCVAFPIVGVWIHHHALHRRGGVVAFQARSLAAVILGNNNAAPVGVKIFVRVQAMRPEIDYLMSRLAEVATNSSFKPNPP